MQTKFTTLTVKDRECHPGDAKDLVEHKRGSEADWR